MSNTSRPTIEEILVKQNYISQAEVDAAKKASPDGNVVNYLLREKKINKDLLGQALAEFNKLDYFDLNSFALPDEVLLSVPENTAKGLRVLVVKRAEKLVEATTDEPDNLDKIKSTLKNHFPTQEIKVYYSLTDDINEVMLRYRKRLQDRVDKIINNDPNFSAKLIDEIMAEAIELRASDIHFEPNPDNILVRYRIDGQLQEAATIPFEFYENVLNRIKVLANMRIDQHLRMQDGAIRYQIKGIIVDLRISIVPILEGQKVVVRILSTYIKNLALQDLGLTDRNFEIIQTASKKTYGMILTTGPTGSGKTTTLYAVIKTLQKAETNITTIEDPVEYRIPGVNQIQVSADNDITFAKGLRSIVRQDPNIILVGEIRDTETAEIAVNAALTGHLLMSTFHANDAATAIPRLLEMGIEPFLLASTLSLVIAQRLVRRTCTTCKYSVDYTSEELEKLVPNHKAYFKTATARLYKGKGCDQCNHTGFRGRIGIFELLYVTDEIQDLILQRASSTEIWKLARSQGASSYFEDGLLKVEAGDIMLEELIRVAPVEFDKKTIYDQKA